MVSSIGCASGPGVADAGGAAVAGEVEAELLQVGQQARLGQVLGDHARAGRERGLDVRLHRQAEFHRLLRQQAGGEQHARVGGVGAGGDGGDQHVAVADVDAVVGLVGLVAVRPAFLPKPLSFTGAENRLVKVLFILSRLMRSCGRFGPASDGHHGGQVELEVLAVVDRARLRHAEHLLRLVVGLEGGDLGVGAAGALEVGDGLVVHREEAHGGAVLGRHVGDGGAVGDRQRRAAFAVELDELADDLGLAQHLGDGEHQVGGGARRVQLALQVHADHVRRQEIHRLAEHAGLGLDAAHAPADHADAVDHGGVAVGADQRVGIVDAVLLVHAAREVLQVHLVHDADARGHDLEGVEGLHAPFHELVALFVALEFQLHVEVERVLGAVVVDLDRVVDHQVDRHQRLDHLRDPCPSCAPRCASPRGRRAGARR